MGNSEEHICLWGLVKRTSNSQDPVPIKSAECLFWTNQLKVLVQNPSFPRFLLSLEIKNNNNIMHYACYVDSALCVIIRAHHKIWFFIRKNKISPDVFKNSHKYIWWNCLLANLFLHVKLLYETPVASTGPWLVFTTQMCCGHDMTFYQLGPHLWMYFSPKTKYCQFWQLCHDWWHCKLSQWQLTVSSASTKLSNWQSIVFTVSEFNHGQMIKSIVFCGI